MGISLLSLDEVDDYYLLQNMADQVKIRSYKLLEASMMNMKFALALSEEVYDHRIPQA